MIFAEDNEDSDIVAFLEASLTNPYNFSPKLRGRRNHMRISAIDRQCFDRLPGHRAVAIITDLDDGQTYSAWRAPCALGCYYDAVISPLGRRAGRLADGLRNGRPNYRLIFEGEPAVPKAISPRRGKPTVS